MLYRSEYNPYFKTNHKLFPAIGFLVDLLQHPPDAGAHLIRRYGLYSSRSPGTWSRKPHLVRLAPAGWKEQHALQSASHLGQPHEQEPHLSVSQKETRCAWARPIAKVYEVDPLRCARCGSKMRVMAVITDPQQIRRNTPPPRQDRSRSPGSGPLLPELDLLAVATAGLTPSLRSSPRSAQPTASA